MTNKLPESHPTLGVPEEVYAYRDASGETFAAVYRFRSKSCSQEVLIPVNRFTGVAGEPATAGFIRATGSLDIAGETGRFTCLIPPIQRNQGHIKRETGQPVHRLTSEQSTSSTSSAFIGQTGGASQDLADIYPEKHSKSAQSAFEDVSTASTIVLSGTIPACNQAPKNSASSASSALSALSAKKEIRPFCLRQQDWKKPVNPVLYELDGLVAHPDVPVILVEGEKCADALNQLGLCATTSFGGSSGAKHSDWSALKGRDVIIWPDYDAPGLKYAESAAEMALAAGTTSVNVVLLQPFSIQQACSSTLSKVGLHAMPLYQKIGWPLVHERALPAGQTGQTGRFTGYTSLAKGWDVADAVAEGWQLEHILALLAQAEPFQPLSSQASASFYANGAGCGMGANDNWPTPDMNFLEEAKAPPTFPLEIFPPGLADWVIQTATSKSAPVDYVAATLLTGTASLIGTARRVMPWSGWSEPAILWTILVGSPSAGKSPAMDPVLSALAKLEGDSLEDHADALCVYETDKLEAELAKERWVQNAKSASDKGFTTPIMPANAILPEMPSRKRLVIKDATTEALLAALKGQPKGFLTVRDELAGWFAGMDRYSASKGGDRALWLEAYGGRPYTLDRVKNGGEPFYIPSLAISVLGGMQPDRMQSCVLKGDDDGLSARFLYIYPNPAPRQRPRHLADDRIINHIISKLDALAPDMDDNKMPCSRIIPLSAAAADLFEVWWQKLLTLAPESGRMSGWWGKAQGLCLRIALVLEYLDWAASADGLEPTEVSVKTIANAISFMENYAGPMAERAHGVASATGYSANTLTLARYLQESGFAEISVRDLQRSGTMRNLTAKEIKAACFDLVGLSWLQAAPVQRGEGTGKNQGRFLLNPAF